MNDRYADARHDVWHHAKKMWEQGLVVASAGNVSRRIDSSLIAITPTSIPYDTMRADEIVVVSLENGEPVDSTRSPSYELPMHLALYRGRDDIGGIVHTHAPYVTTLSVLRRKLPPVIDEMTLYFGGTIEVADYAFTGTPEVGKNVLRALGDRTGVILSNHGNVCVGRDLPNALHVAVTMESAARVYIQALALGFPKPIPESAVRSGRKLFDERRR